MTGGLRPVRFALPGIKRRPVPRVDVSQAAVPTIAAAHTCGGRCQQCDALRERNDTLRREKRALVVARRDVEALERKLAGAIRERARAEDRASSSDSKRLLAEQELQALQNERVVLFKKSLSPLIPDESILDRARRYILLYQ